MRRDWGEGSQRFGDAVGGKTGTNGILQITGLKVGDRTPSQGIARGMVHGQRLHGGLDELFHLDNRVEQLDNLFQGQRGYLVVGFC